MVRSIHIVCKLFFISTVTSRQPYEQFQCISQRHLIQIHKANIAKNDDSTYYRKNIQILERLLAASRKSKRVRKMYL